MLCALCKSFQRYANEVRKKICNFIRSTPAAVGVRQRLLYIKVFQAIISVLLWGQNMFNGTYNPGRTRANNAFSDSTCPLKTSTLIEVLRIMFFGIHPIFNNNIILRQKHRNERFARKCKRHPKTIIFF